MRLKNKKVKRGFFYLAKLRFRELSTRMDAARAAVIRDLNGETEEGMKGKHRKLHFIAKTGLATIALGGALLWSNAVHPFAIQTCDTSIPSPPRTCAAGDLTQGWDGPGLGSYNFTYFVGNPGRADGGLPAGLTLADVTGAFQRAAATWASVVQITFAPAAGFGLGDIDFYFHNGAGGVPDGIPFDGPWIPFGAAGSVFAHSWGPPDVVQPGPGFTLPGNMHFDIAETWTVGAGGSQFVAGVPAIIDLESIIVHELGHALGLDHEDDLGAGPGAPIMQSFHNVNGIWARTLTADDISGIQTLYCPVGQPCGTNGTPEPSTMLLLGMGLFAMRLLRKSARQ